MLDKLLELVPEKKTRDVLSMAGGMLLLLAGRKSSALGLFTRGALGVEDTWKEKHPDFQGGFSERWGRAIEFYDRTHQEPTNRKLHMVGIPMIVGGAIGLLAFRPFRTAWWGSASAFTVGWGLNFVGHGLYEKNAPAFADDALSFLAGPAWDLQQLVGGQPIRVQPAA